jgi:hypothetical protein
MLKYFTTVVGATVVGVNSGTGITGVSCTGTATDTGEAGPLGIPSATLGSTGAGLRSIALRGTIGTGNTPISTGAGLRSIALTGTTEFEFGGVGGSNVGMVLYLFCVSKSYFLDFSLAWSVLSLNYCRNLSTYLEISTSVNKKSERTNLRRIALE